MVSPVHIPRVCIQEVPYNGTGEHHVLHPLQEVLHVACTGTSMVAYHHPAYLPFGVCMQRWEAWYRVPS